MGGESNAIACCMRCGFSYKWETIKREQSGLRVCEDCYDGKYQAINHPQNFPPTNIGPDSVLPWTNPDVRLSAAPSIGTFDVLRSNNAFNYVFIPTSSSSGPG